MEDEGSRVSCVIAMILIAIAMLLPFAGLFILLLGWQPCCGDAVR